MELHKSFDHCKYSLCVNKKNILGGYSSFFKPKAWNYLQFDWINLYWVVKSSQLLVKIPAYLVSGIGCLLCLAFLYGWRFFNEISLDWPLTLTTQPTASSTIFILTTLLHTCQLSRIIRESAGYDTNLPVSRTGRFISRIKSSFELFCALVWNLAHF